MEDVKPSIDDLNRLIRYIDSDNHMMIDYIKVLNLIEKINRTTDEVTDLNHLAKHLSAFMK